MLPRRFLPEFFTDADEAADWYELKRMGLGNEFRMKLVKILERISDMPELFSIVDGTTHVAVIHPFSYGVYFRIEPTELVITGVLHLHRHPGLWRRRK